MKFPNDFDSYLITATSNGLVAQSIACCSTGHLDGAPDKYVHDVMLRAVTEEATRVFGDGVDFDVSWVKGEQASLNMEN